MSGWTFRSNGARLAAVSAVVDGLLVGGTSLVCMRPDVAKAFGLDQRTPCGFAFRVEDLPFDSTIEMTIEARFDETVETIGTVVVRTSSFDATREDFGTLGDSAFDVVLRRDDIYGAGPPSPVADQRCVSNILGYAAPGDDVLDVGCGIGAYAEPLISAGVLWHGCEVVPEFVEAMSARGLDVTRSPGSELPFDDGSFDLAICIEVLEHIDRYEAFAGEIARVVRRGALFSVPNCGAIPRYAPLAVVPWHLLEGTHLNFFTTASLRRLLERFFANVEVTEYGPLPVRAADGTPVYNHLFAVAMHEREGG